MARFKKTDLIRALVEQTNLTEKEAKQVIYVFFKEIRKGMLRGDEVNFKGFGVFRVHQSVGRVGRNPVTGQECWIEPRKVPKFRFHDGFKKYFLD